MLQRQIIQIQSLYIVYGTSEILRGLKKVEQFGITLKIWLPFVLHIVKRVSVGAKHSYNFKTITIYN